MFFKHIKTLPFLFLFAYMPCVLFVLAKFSRKKIKNLKLPWWPHSYCYWVKRYFYCFLLTLSKSKTPFGRNSVTYGTLCHAIGHFVFYYHHVTCRTSCHASGRLVIYSECYGFERAFFTLRCFWPYTPSC